MPERIPAVTMVPVLKLGWTVRARVAALSARSLSNSVSPSAVPEPSTRAPGLKVGVPQERPAVPSRTRSLSGVAAAKPEEPEGI